MPGGPSTRINRERGVTKAFISKGVLDATISSTPPWNVDLENESGAAFVLFLIKARLMNLLQGAIDSLSSEAMELML